MKIKQFIKNWYPSIIGFFVVWAYLTWGIIWILMEYRIL